MWMAMCGNGKGKVVVLSHMKSGHKNSGTRIFILEGETAHGWLQMMEAIYEVSGVKVKAPDWVTKQDKKTHSGFFSSHYY